MQTDGQITKIWVLLDKDSEITMLKDIVANLYNNIIEDIGNFCTEVKTAVLMKNKREKARVKDKTPE